MFFSTEIVQQMFVLAGILAGFGLSITAQIALGNDDAKKKRQLSIDFVKSSVLCLVAIIIGLLFLMTSSDILGGMLMYGLGGGSFLLLQAGVFYFVLAVNRLVVVGMGMSSTWIWKFLTDWIQIAGVVTILTIIVGLVANRIGVDIPFIPELTYGGFRNRNSGGP